MQLFEFLDELNAAEGRSQFREMIVAIIFVGNIGLELNKKKSVPMNPQ